MVSLWPWRRNSSSTASFEKTLSTLSAKIADTQARLERVRSSSRRVKALWTLYLSLAYVVSAVVLLLVVGYKNMGTYEWAGMIGGPVFIYATRALLAAYYNFRTDSLATRLKEQQQERAKTIQKLKDATKYDSTLELIEKYGGKKKGGAADGEDEAGDGSGSGSGGNKSKRPMHSNVGSQQGTPTRTGMPPPPTANIQRRDAASPATTPQASPLPRRSAAASPLEPGAEFAPNADAPLPSPPAELQQYASPGGGGGGQPHWYDRLFDVLLGEDEAAPKNRIVLICQRCRLVNGQAPPGTRSLSELGRWRCMACGAENGEAEDEGRRIVREVLGGSPATLGAAKGSGVGGEEKEEEEEEDEPQEKREKPQDASSDVGEDGDDGAEVAETEGPAAAVRRRRGRGNNK